jgi:hypothetical protein
MQAGMGEAGAVTTVGTPLLIQAKQASELELKNLMIGYEGATEAARARSEAAGYKMEGKIARRKGRAGMIGGFLGAGGTLLTGFSGMDWGKGGGGLTKEGKATLLRY